jgi:hypothetical protein
MTVLDEIKELKQTTAAASQTTMVTLARALAERVSGDLHDRLLEVNDDSSPEALLDLAKALCRESQNLLLDSTNRFVAFYWFVLGTTREMKSAELAAKAWTIARRFFIKSLKQWEQFKLPEIGDPASLPEFYDLIRIAEYLRQVLREYADKADQEYRAYKETAFLLRSPQNAKHLEESIKQASSGKTKRYSSVADFISANAGKVSHRKH